MLALIHLHSSLTDPSTPRSLNRGLRLPFPTQFYLGTKQRAHPTGRSCRNWKRSASVVDRVSNGELDEEPGNLWLSVGVEIVVKVPDLHVIVYYILWWTFARLVAFLEQKLY